MRKPWERSRKSTNAPEPLEASPPPSLSNQDLRLPRLYQRGNGAATEIPINVPERPLPQVYPFAEHLAHRLGARRIVDLGCGTGEALAALDPAIETVGIDNSQRNLSIARSVFSDRQWIEADLATDLDSLSGHLDGALVILANVLEYLIDPLAVLDWLREHQDVLAGVVVAGADRSRTEEAVNGPPSEGVATWNFQEFSSLLRSHGLQPFLHGHTRSLSTSGVRSSQVAFVPGHFTWPPPKTISAIAYVPCFNEIDIIGTTVARLLEQGIDVHVVDNWSTDGTYELLQEKFSSDPRVEVTRWPDEPSPDHQWAAMLDHIDHQSANSNFDWILHVDADEQFDSPTPEFGLLHLMGLADANGYDVIDTTLIDFRPEMPGAGLREQTRGNLPARWEFATRPGARIIERMWRNRKEPAGISESGGHAVTVAKRVFPCNAILRHYPLRSPEHARQKVLVDRIPRYTRGRAERGWHVQYDQYADGDASFLWDSTDLNDWEWHTPHEWVIEFASRRGIDFQS